MEEVSTVDNLVGANEDEDDVGKVVPLVRNVVRLVLVDEDGILTVGTEVVGDVVTEERLEDFNVVDEETIVEEGVNLLLDVEVRVGLVDDDVLTVVPFLKVIDDVIVEGNVSVIVVAGVSDVDLVVDNFPSVSCELVLVVDWGLDNVGGGFAVDEIFDADVFMVKVDVIVLNDDFHEGVVNVNEIGVDVVSGKRVSDVFHLDCVLAVSVEFVIVVLNVEGLEKSLVDAVVTVDDNGDLDNDKDGDRTVDDVAFVTTEEFVEEVVMVSLYAEKSGCFVDDAADKVVVELYEDDDVVVDFGVVVTVCDDDEVKSVLTSVVDGVDCDVENGEDIFKVDEKVEADVVS